MRTDRLFLVTVIAAFFVLGAAPARAQTAAEPKLIDAIAAVVGDQVILESEVDEELYIYQMRSGGQIPKDQIQSVRSQILRDLVEESLLVAKAQRDTIEVTDEELNDEIDRRVADLREQHGSEEAFEAALAEGGLTLDELKDIYRDDIRRRLLAQKVVQREVTSKIDVTWGEVEKYYNDNKDTVAVVPEAYQIEAILVTPKVSEKAKAGAIARLTEARERIGAGEPFADVARDVSDDASAARGGDLGTFGRGVMVPEFERAVFALAPGELSGIVPTRFGFHLIQVLEKNDDTVHARHILARVVPGPDDDERARAKAESLRVDAAEGASFEDLAREYSDDETSRGNGGMLGWFRPEELDPQILAAVTGLEPGQISSIVRGDRGYYVIKVVAHDMERVASLDEIREDLRDYLFRRKAEEGYRNLIDRLSHEIFVDIRDQGGEEGQG
jgi:peptidyl-prolyl cis-trans isomerase SurA